MNLAEHAADPVDEDANLRLTELLDAGIVAKREAEPRRDYLGGSRLGVECERQLGYEYAGVPVDPGKGFSGRTYRIFQRGHDAETRMADYLRMAGFDLVTEREDGSQFGFGIAKDRETGKARIAGHIDGAITGWAAPMNIPPRGECEEWAKALPFPMLWEHKGLKHSSWGDLCKKGLKKSKPVYYAQVQVYMAYMDLKHAFFTAENQDTCEIYMEIVPFHAKDAQSASDRGVRVVSARAPEELPRCAAVPTDYRCRFCSFAARCWSEAARPVQTIAPPAGWGSWS